MRFHQSISMVQISRYAAVLVALALCATPGILATTWVVNPAGGGDATTIAGAVALASDGDTLTIANGTYTESVSTTTGLTYVAATQGQVTWKASSTICLEMTSGTSVNVHGIGFSDSEQGIYTLGLTGTTKVRDCTFEDMATAAAGAGIYCYNTQLDIEDCTFTNCAVTGGTGNGGGIYLYHQSAGSRIVDVDFATCTAEQVGGGICTVSVGETIDECTFTSCEANYGGGLNSYSSNSTISDCVFTSCTATTDGGGMRMDSSSGGNTISTCNFTTNSAGVLGGAIAAHGLGGTGTISGCLFDSNTALNGAGIYEANCNGNLTGNTFYRNEADNQGSAIYLLSGSPNIKQSIFCNSVDAAAIHCQGVPTVACNDFYGNTSGNVSGCSEPSALDDNIFTNPEFCDAPGGDFTLTTASPCAAGNGPVACTGRMGCRDAACDTSPVRVVSWGELMSIFR